MCQRMEETEIDCWTDFEAEIQRLIRLQQKQTTSGIRGYNELLFRGAGNSTWGLETTLERSYPLERSNPTMSLRKYYLKVSRAKGAIETLTGRRRDIPSPPKFGDSLNSRGADWLDRILSEHHEIYECLVYFRHHGFPSPLLDWSASPYVAAFFAFDGAARDAQHACVYAFLQDCVHAISGDHHLFVVGPYIRSHPRHYAQQSRYTMCVRLDSRGDGDRDYLFCPHDEGMPEAVGPDGRLFKIKIPATLRVRALKHLDLMNINPYTVYGSEDSLVRAIARRECLFQDWD